MFEELWYKAKYYSNILSSKRGNRLQRYGIPLIILLIFFVGRSLFYSVFRDTPFLLLSFPVIIAAWFGGLGPGLATTAVASILSNFIFFTPDFTRESAFKLGLFVAEGIMISIISEAKKQAEGQKDAFVAFASHELKSPLTIIKGYIDLIFKTAQRRKDKKLILYASKAGSSINLVSELVNDMLDITNIEAGQLVYRDSEFSIFNLVKEVVEDQRIVHHDCDIRIAGKTNRKVFADRYRISQVLVNFISNAVKYPEDSDLIIVKLKNTPTTVQISVNDKGIGMTPAAQKKIFHYFYRSEAAKQKAHGTGLGLYIAKQIVKRHGGKIFVKSKLNKGSTFTVELKTL